VRLMAEETEELWDRLTEHLSVDNWEQLLDGSRELWSDTRSGFELGGWMGESLDKQKALRMVDLLEVHLGESKA
jgi:hypothetical protein